MTSNSISEGKGPDEVERALDVLAQDSALVPVVAWQDQDALLRTLWLENKTPDEISEQLGRSVAAIMTRAARLSLPRRSAPGRKRGYKRTDAPRRIRSSAVSTCSKMQHKSSVCDELEEVVNPEIVARVCLMCLKKFQSQGRHNRICPSCKGSAEYSTGSATPDFAFQIGK